MLTPQQLESGGFRKRLADLCEAQFNGKHSPAERLFKEAGWIGMSEVLFLFGISKRTLQSWRSKRLIGYSRMEKTIVYNIFDILRSLKENTVNRVR